MKKITFTLALLFALTAVAFGQTTAEEWFARAGELFNNGDYTNAITAYSEVIRRDRSNLDAYWIRGVAYFQIRNYDACIADCTIVINDAPDFSRVYVVRGDAYGAKGMYHKAISDYRTGWEKGYDTSNFNVDKSNNGDMWFCGAMYIEILVNRFLGNSSNVTKYENWLNTVCNNNRVTRAEIETFYRNNIRALVSQVVDEEFNKVSFPLRNLAADRTYDTVLIRNPQTGQYTIKYDRASIENDDKTLTAASLEALLTEMRRNTTDFVQSDIDTVRTQAALIPAVVYDGWRTRGLGDGMALIKETLTNFYLNPSRDTYNAMLGIYARYRVLGGAGDNFSGIALDAYRTSMRALSTELIQKVGRDMQQVNIMNTARIPNDRRYDIFSTPYTTGGR